MLPIPSRRAVLGAGAALAATGALPRRACAQAAPIRIGVLADMSGVYADNTGQGMVAAAELAVEDFLRANPGALRVEIVSADLQNRVDVAMQIARRWFDRDGVDVIAEISSSAAALAAATLVKERNKVLLLPSAGASELTGPACSPNHIQWTYDSWALAHGTATAVVGDGGNSWYFLTADYAFGHSLERDATAFIRAAGGQVLGAARHPSPGTTDFSSFLAQAAGSRAKVLGLANAGGDVVNCIKQSAEFGLTRRGMRLAGILLQATDIHSIGLAASEGLTLTDPFYWDMNDGTRDFARRFAPRHKNLMPIQNHAGMYSAVLHYLKAVHAMGTAEAKADGAALVRRMKEIPTDDPLFGPGRIRTDGRKIHPMHVFRVKSPNESRYPWDYYRLVRSFTAEDAFRPMREGGCPMVPA